MQNGKSAGEDNVHCVQFWNGVEMLWRLKKGKTLSGNVGQGHFSDASRVSIWA